MTNINMKLYVCICVCMCMHRYQDIFNFRILFATSRTSCSKKKIDVEHKMFVPEFFEGVLGEMPQVVSFSSTVIWTSALKF